MAANGLITRPDVLSESFVPDAIPGRNDHLEELKRCLAPAIKGRKPIHALVFGPSGSGKTVTAKTVLRWLEGNRVTGVYVNCREHNSLYSILELPFYNRNKKGAPSAEPRRCAGEAAPEPRRCAAEAAPERL